MRAYKVIPGTTLQYYTQQKGFPEELLYPVIEHILHNGTHVRCTIAVGDSRIFRIDIPLQLFSTLSIVNVPDDVD
jgi:hypothetical protein